MVIFDGERGRFLGFNLVGAGGDDGEEVEMNKVAQASHWLYNHMMHKHHHVYSLF